MIIIIFVSLLQRTFSMICLNLDEQIKNDAYETEKHVTAICIDAFDILW